jgi:hypothetical protein
VRPLCLFLKINLVSNGKTKYLFLLVKTQTKYSIKYIL